MLALVREKKCKEERGWDRCSTVDREGGERGLGLRTWRRWELEKARRQRLRREPART